MQPDKDDTGISSPTTPSNKKRGYTFARSQLIGGLSGLAVGILFLLSREVSVNTVSSVVLFLIALGILVALCVYIFFAHKRNPERMRVVDIARYAILFFIVTAIIFFVNNFFLNSPLNQIENQIQSGSQSSSTPAYPDSNYP